DVGVPNSFHGPSWITPSRDSEEDGGLAFGGPVKDDLRPENVRGSGNLLPAYSDRCWDEVLPGGGVGLALENFHALEQDHPLLCAGLLNLQDVDVNRIVT